MPIAVKREKRIRSRKAGCWKLDLGNWTLDAGVWMTCSNPSAVGTPDGNLGILPEEKMALKYMSAVGTLEN